MTQIRDVIMGLDWVHIHRDPHPVGAPFHSKIWFLEFVIRRLKMQEYQTSAMHNYKVTRNIDPTYTLKYLTNQFFMKCLQMSTHFLNVRYYILKRDLKHIMFDEDTNMFI